MSKAVRFAAFAWALGLGGCGRQELDLLVTTQPEDACASFQTKAECDASSGCSFQPNTEGCLSSDPSCPAGLCRAGDPYVRRVERSFVLNGTPFRFVGVSSWALLEGTQCTTSKPEDRDAWMQQAYDDLVPSRSKVARFFAFQSSAGATGDDFTLFDASVRYARRAGVRLMFILEHGKGDCSFGGERDAAWYAGGYKSPDNGYALSYLDFARVVADRYRNEPTVLGYVLMHGLAHQDTEAVSGFVNDVGQVLHGATRNQMVSLDLNWYGAGADGGASYRALQELPEVDIVDIDDYSFQEALEPLDPNLLDLLSTIDKPTIVGEGAFVIDRADDGTLARRAERARQRLTQWRDWGFAGGLLWAYQPGWTTPSDEFDARPTDPLLQPGGVVGSAPW